MIGLTAGLVIEGQTGKNIMTQVKIWNYFFLHVLFFFGHTHMDPTRAQVYIQIWVGIVACTHQTHY